MRVAVDGRAFTAAAGGVRRYVSELWRAMPAAAPDVEGYAVGGIREVAHACGLTHVPTGRGWPTNIGWSAWTLPRALRHVSADVVHAPAYTAPLWGARPLVLTIHDVSYARHPEWYPHQSGPLRQAFYRRSATRADHVVTDSAFSKAEIIAAYGLDPERITVVPLGVSDRFRVSPDVARESVVLHVGDLHPRRNLEMLIDVVRALRAADARLRDVRVVLVGADRGGWASLRGRSEGLVEWVSDGDDAALARWYQRAAVLAYPSKYEGFGLPLLEAMASGTPVVASAAASIPEVVGTAALVVDPDDRDAWGRALREVLLSSDTRARLVDAGLQRAAVYSWRETARQTAGVWRAAAEAARLRRSASRS